MNYPGYRQVGKEVAFLSSYVVLCILASASHLVFTRPYKAGDVIPILHMCTLNFLKIRHLVTVAAECSDL